MSTEQRTMERPYADWTTEQLIQQLGHVEKWLDYNAPIDRQTPWLIRRDIVREAMARLDATDQGRAVGDDRRMGEYVPQQRAGISRGDCARRGERVRSGEIGQILEPKWPQRPAVPIQFYGIGEVLCVGRKITVNPGSCKTYCGECRVLSATQVPQPPPTKNTRIVETPKAKKGRTRAITLDDEDLV